MDKQHEVISRQVIYQLIIYVKLHEFHVNCGLALVRVVAQLMVLNGQQTHVCVSLCHCLGGCSGTGREQREVGANRQHLERQAPIYRR